MGNSKKFVFILFCPAICCHSNYVYRRTFSNGRGMNELYNLPHRLKKINRFCKSYLNTLESIQNQTETTEFHLIKLQFEEIKILSFDLLDWEQAFKPPRLWQQKKSQKPQAYLLELLGITESRTQNSAENISRNFGTKKLEKWVSKFWVLTLSKCWLTVWGRIQEA